jgi:hypothetical protein
VFVGRDVELAALHEAWDVATAGGSAIVELVGEAGIGKTTLVRELLGSIDPDRHMVLAGACDEGWSAPYLCLGRAAAELVERRGVDEATRAYASWLAQLSPRLDAALDHPASPIVEEREGDTARLVLAFVRWLRAQTSERAGVVVIDDLQWIDAESALLVRRLLVDLVPNLLIVLARRGTATHGPAAASVVEAAAQSRGHRLQLSGLDSAAVASLAAGAGRDKVDADALHRRSNGNPLFVRALLDERDDIGAQSTVSILFSRRLETFAESAQQVVRAASLDEGVASVAVVAAVTGQSEDEVIEALELGARAGLVTELAVDQWDFVHDVARQAVRTTVGASQRARLHSRFASTLTQLRPDDDVALAHHHRRSGSIEGTRAAVDHLVKAGDAAMSRVAFLSAHDFFATAAALLAEIQDADDGSLRREIDLRAGIAARRAGLEGWAASLRAVTIEARDRGDDDLLVRAVIARNRGWHTELGRTDEEAVGLLEDALQKTGPDDPRRADVLATLATELAWVADRSRPDALAEEAIAIARRIGTPRLLLDVFDKASSARTNPATLAWRLALADESVTLAEQHGDARDRVTTLFKRMHCRFESGLTDEAREDWRAIESVIVAQSEVGQDDPWSQRSLEQCRFVFGVAEGRLDDAEEAANRAVVIGNSMQMTDALTSFSAHLFQLRWLQGRLAEVVELADAARGLATVPGFVAAYALARAATGSLDRAEAEIESVDLAAIPQDLNWVTCMCAWAEAAHLVGHRTAAATLHEMLSPFADQIVYSNPIVFGSMHRTIGKLAAVLGDLNSAADHLEQAIVVNHVGRLHTFEALARYELAIVRRDLGEPGDLTIARTLAEEIGMLGLVRDIDAYEPR